MAIGLPKENNKNYFSQTTSEKTGAAKTTGARVVSWPNRQEVYDYCDELSSSVNPDKFFDYYEERKWQTASGPIYDWKALFRSWDKKEFKRTPSRRLGCRFGENPVKDEDVEYFMKNSEKLLAKLRAGNAE